MARSRSPDSIKAEELFHSGMSLVDIAKKLKKPEGTVRRWKSTQRWEDKGERSEKKDEQKASVRKQNKAKVVKAIADDVSQVISNPDLTDKQRLFCLYYVKCFNATRAYQKAYECSYETAMTEGCNLLRNPKIKAEILKLKQNRLNRELLDESDIFQKYMDIAFADITDYVDFGNEERTVITKNGDSEERTVNFVNINDSSNVNGSIVREVSQGKEGIKIKLLDQMKALDWLSEHMDLATSEQQERVRLLRSQADKAEKEVEDIDKEISQAEMKDPHDVVIPEFWEILDDTEHEHIIITSGRAGTKSSLSGVLGISTIVGDEPTAVVVLRKRHNKIRKTVYKEMIRAITRLGLNKDDFNIGVTPMEIRYKKNGNVIYFAGSDSIDDTKGIIDEDKPIRLVMQDELTEFFDVGEGEDELTNIEATFVRGNDEGFRMVYLYNPPKNPNAAINAWCKKMELRPDTIHKHVDYRDVPISWIGKKLIESAEMLKEIDFKLYSWVWLGECTGVDDLIYYMFNGSHVKEPIADYYKIIGIGVDYGQQNATTFQAVGLNISSRKLEGVGEYYHSGRDTGKQKSPSDYAKEFIELTDELHEKYSCSIFYAYIDPTAKGLAEEIKRLAMQSRKYGISIKDAENSVDIGIQRTQKCLTYQVMTISERQPNLVREMGTYEYDPKTIDTGKEKPLKKDDHCVDALRYVVMGLWDKIKYFMPAGEREE